MNLLSGKPNITNSYFCTWAAQNFVPLPRRLTERPQARDMMTEEFLFGENGVAHQYPDIRKNLILILDDGWDVGFGLNMGYDREKFGSLIVNSDRFPSCTGTPVQRLRTLNKKITSLGWRGLGLWICANGIGERPGALFSEEAARHYWSERLGWCHDAGVAYWKVDWGHHERDASFRKMLCDIGSEIAPDLIIENAGCCPPFNGILQDASGPYKTGRFRDWGDEPEEWMKIFGFSQVFRSYDVSESLSVPTSLDRVYGILDMAERCPNTGGIINCEDEMYLGAALGCNLGIMRCPVCKPEGEHTDPQHVYCRTDEVRRAVNWQTFFAPPFGVGGSEVYASEEILFDTHDFADRSIWIEQYCRKISQGAPAVVARDMCLPQVSVPQGDKPYIVSAKFPNGAVAIASLPRKKGQYEFYTPKADVSVRAGSISSPVGVFGYFRSLELTFDGELSGRRLLAQDLVSSKSEASDITDLVTINNNSVLIDGNVLQNTGSLSAESNDSSYPGVVLCLI